MLSDAQWAELELPVEACQPKSKMPPQDLRRTVSAILWRHQNGAKWRAVPAELGPWWRAAQIFIRWARAGVWERLLSLVQERGVQLGMVFLDGTSVRAHQKAAGAAPKGGSQAERDHREALGRSRGGYGTKACVIADGAGRAIAFRIAPGQAHELPQAIPLLDQLPGVPKWVVGDRGYTGNRFREHVWGMGARPAIPPQRHEAPVACLEWIYTNRNRVERHWARLKCSVPRCGTRHAMR
ncbi:IS5 family transposase [Methylobacterium durans]|uniref:IS5 family transposase n=1 Tax=Methylobacterium durans TaxID=2202825 RepID=A0A2U8W8V1_9HYPH|nr:IS5 family transposase [Methylobacterium durans]